MTCWLEGNNFLGLEFYIILNRIQKYSTTDDMENAKRALRKISKVNEKKLTIT